MKDKFVINDMVIYHPEQHRLTPLGSRGKETLLNVPASRCLLLMLQRPGVNIIQEEFFKKVWENNGQYVTPNTFYQNISLIRKGIRNAGIRNPVIRTLPKVGLIFTGTVQIINNEDYEPVASAKITGEDTLGDIEAVKVEHSPSQEKDRTSLQKPTGSKITKPSLFNRRGIVIAINLILTLVIILFITYRYIVYPILNIPNRTSFFGEHMHIFTINQCDVLINKQESNANRERFADFLRSKDVSCNANEFLYITNSPLTIKKIIMRCQASANSSVECKTIYPFI